MTDYGALIKNTTGRVCIDSTYRNHVFHQKGSSSVSLHLNEIDMIDTTDSCILFIKPPSGIFAAPYGFKRTAGAYDKLVIAASGNGTVEWIVFKEGPKIPTTGEYGFFVYNVAGDVVFNSNEKYFNIIDDFQFYGTPGMSYRTLNVVSTDNYFWINGNLVWAQALFSTTVYKFIEGIKYRSATEIDVGLVNYANLTTGTLWSDWASIYKGPARIIEIENRNF